MAKKTNLEQITDLTDTFCRKHLDAEYAALCRKLAAALDALEPSPLDRGRADIWACGITYALARINFLFDPSFQPYLSAAQLCELYGVRPGTAKARTQQIIEMLELTPFHPEFSTSFMEQSNPLPLLTPAPVLRAGSDEDTLKVYMVMRERVGRLQDELFVQLGREEIIGAATRLGLWRQEAVVLPSEGVEMVFADHALYSTLRNGRTLMELAIEKLGDDDDPIMRSALEGMRAAVYSVFEISEASSSGVMLARDLLNQVVVPVIDITLAANASPGSIFASRVLPFPTFAMLAGPPMAIDHDTIDLIEQEVNASIPSDTITDVMTAEQRVELEAAIIRACLSASPGEMGAGDMRGREPRTAPPEKIYQLHIQLDDIEPPIWRRVLVASDNTLAQLHDIIQYVMPWEDRHLHSFHLNGVTYEPVHPENKGLDEAAYRLHDLLTAEGATIRYWYDFGDDWYHTIRLEKISAPAGQRSYPRLVAGERAAPPEDSGGPGGYFDLLVAVRTPAHPEHAHLKEWLPEGFDPEQFSRRHINDLLEDLREAGY